jgi:outer membrane protein OmpA-like peptidoglycan-associated protein
MKCRLVLVVIAMLLLPGIDLFAQQATSEASTPEAQFIPYWVAYWAKPSVVLFGPPEEGFNSNVHEVLFPNNVYDAPENPSILDDNAQWLKDHASDHFYIEGYASSKGEPGYNLRLSKQRADWVKQTLISKGIPEDRILMAAGWGQYYPVCAELDDACWSKNRIVRFVYSPHQ